MFDPFSFTHYIPHLLNTRTLTSKDRATWDAILSGDLTCVHKHWYIPRSSWESLAWYERRALHSLAVGKSARTAVLMGRAAARLQGIWVISTTYEAVEVGFPNANAPGIRDRSHGVCYRYSEVPEDVITTALGVAVTNPLRTVIDICLFHGFLEGLIACDWALSHGFKREDLWRELKRSGRRRGVKHARQAIKFASHLSESAPESLARGLLVQAGYEDIVLQYKIGTYRTDLLIHGFLVIEVDGDGKYLKDHELAEKLRQERKREKYLQNQGYWVIRFRPYEVLKNPARFLRDVQAALDARARSGEVVRRGA